MVDIASLDKDFNSGNFENLKQQLESIEFSNGPAHPKADYYRGLLALYGIEEVIDEKKAEMHLINSFNDGKGYIKASEDLINLYKKQKNYSKLKEFLEKISSLPNLDNNPYAEYAKYELNLLRAKDLLQKNQLEARNIDEDFIQAATRIAKELEGFINKLEPDSPLYAYAIYEKAKIHLYTEKAELKTFTEQQHQEFKSRINHFTETQAKFYKHEIEEFEHTHQHLDKKKKDFELEKLKRVLKTKQANKLEEFKKTLERKQSEELKAKQEKLFGFLLLKSAKEKFYTLGIQNNPAQAELINIEVESLIENYYSSQQYGAIKNHRDNIINQAFSKCNDALSTDSENIGARLLKHELLMIKADNEALRTPNKPNQEYYKLMEEATSVIREALKLEPDNKIAQSKMQTLKYSLVRHLTTSIISELKTKAIQLDEAILLRNIRGQGDKNINQYFESLSPIIADNLGKSLFLTQQMKWSELNKTGKLLGEQIWLESETKFKKLEGKNQEIGLREIDQEAAKVIGSWNDSNNSVIVDDLSPYEKRRKEFRKLLRDKLDRYYNRCIVLTDPDTDLEVKLNDSSLALDAAEAILPVAAVATSSYSLAAGSSALKTIRHLSREGQKAALYRAAEKFAQIGNRNHEEAGKRFDFIVDKIVEEYGMQIDNVTSIDNLASIASEKMLDHVANASMTKELFEALSKPELAATQLIKAITGLKINSEEPPEKALLDGIFKGNSKSANKLKIDTADGRVGDDVWKGDEIFEKPVVTTNGKEFYCEDSQKLESNKYGARFRKEIPGNLVKKTVSENDQNAMKQAFDRHQTMHYSPRWRSTDERKELFKTAVNIDIEEKAQEERILKTRRMVEIAKLIFGLGVMGCAKVVAVAIAVGAIASGFGIPLAVGIGLVGLYCAIKGAHKALEISSKVKEVSIEKHKAEFNQFLYPELNPAIQKERKKNLIKDYKKGELSKQLLLSHDEKKLHIAMKVMGNWQKMVENSREKPSISSKTIKGA